MMSFRYYSPITTIITAALSVATLHTANAYTLIPSAIITDTAISSAYIKISTDEDKERQKIGEEARAFIKQMTENALNFLSDETLTNAQKREHFQTLLETSFDIPTIGKYALGQYWRTATAEQKQKYQELFKRNIIDLYASRFSDYNGQIIETTDFRPHGKKDIMVKSHILDPKNTNVKIDIEWRVRFKNGEYRIIDVYVENVSMAINQRSDYRAVIQRGGGSVDVLINHLEK